MPRKTKQEQEQAYLRNFWDEIREMEADYGGVVQVSMDATNRPGVFVLRISFTPFLGTEDNPIGSCFYKRDFPDSYNTSLAGAYWSAALRLLQLVEVQMKGRLRTGLN